MHLVGTGLLPQTTYNAYDAGGWVSAADYGRLFTGFLNHWGLLRLRPGADPLRVTARVNRVADAAGAGGYLFPDVAAVPDRLAGVRDIRGLPLALGGFLAVLGVGAVGHGLATAVRRRAEDVTVLRALGMTRRQTRAALLTQAAVTAAVALVVGVPLRLALGRTLWRTVAAVVPLQYQQPGTGPVLLTVAAGVVVVAGAFAVWTGARATRLDIARTPRAE